MHCGVPAREARRRGGSQRTEREDGSRLHPTRSRTRTRNACPRGSRPRHPASRQRGGTRPYGREPPPQTSLTSGEPCLKYARARFGSYGSATTLQGRGDKRVSLASSPSRARATQVASRSSMRVLAACSGLSRVAERPRQGEPLLSPTVTWAVRLPSATLRPPLHLHGSIAGYLGHFGILPFQGFALSAENQRKTQGSPLRPLRELQSIDATIECRAVWRVRRHCRNQCQRSPIGSSPSSWDRKTRRMLYAWQSEWQGVDQRKVYGCGGRCQAKG